MSDLKRITLAISLLFGLSSPLQARGINLQYICADNQPLTISYYLGESTDNATATFDGQPHKMYYDPDLSDNTAWVFKEEPYILHVQNKPNIRMAKVISIIEEVLPEDKDESTPKYTLLHADCTPKNSR